MAVMSINVKNSIHHKWQFSWVAVVRMVVVQLKVDAHCSLQVSGLMQICFCSGLRSSCKNEMAPAPELSVFVSMAPAPELCFFVTWLRLCFVNTLQQFRYS